MYLWITFVTRNGVPLLSYQACEANIFGAPETDAEVLRERRASVMDILGRTRPQLVDVERARVIQALNNLVQCLPADHDDLDFAIHLGLAHFCLPPQQRAAREQRIDSTLEQYFGPPPSRRAEFLAPAHALQTLAVLFPDVVIASWISGNCGIVLAEAFTDPDCPEIAPRAKVHHDAINHVLLTLKLGTDELNALSDTLALMYCVLAPAQRQLLVDLVLSPPSRPSLPILLPAFTGLSHSDHMLTPFDVVDCLFGLLQQAVTDGQKAGDPLAARLVEEWVLRGVQQRDFLCEKACNTTIEALAEGVPMGERGRATHAALLTHRLAMRRLNRRLAPNQAAKATVPAKVLTHSTGPNDLEPVHAWSVARLVRWIEGPLTERTANGRLNRQRVVAREKMAIEKDTADQLVAGQPPDAAPPPLSEDDVGLIINEGLSATARFFHDDIQELLPLTRSLGAAPDLLHDCEALLKSLQELGALPATIDEEKARLLLEHAERCIGLLRKGVKVAQVSAQQVRQFRRQLASALKAETLVLGKRHGGVIAAPLRTADWAWVQQTCHRRWLPRVRNLVVDGEPIALPFDQAIALYVTGSSLSGHAFDISVHLWQRRAGRTSTPGELTEDFPPMNTADWFDTYIPCAVLHVPRAG